MGMILDNFHGREIDVSFEIEGPSGDGWNEPHYAGGVTIYSVTHRGREIDLTKEETAELEEYLAGDW